MMSKISVVVLCALMASAPVPVTPTRVSLDDIQEAMSLLKPTREDVATISGLESGKVDLTKEKFTAADELKAEDDMHRQQGGFDLVYQCSDHTMKRSGGGFSDAASAEASRHSVCFKLRIGYTLKGQVVKEVRMLQREEDTRERLPPTWQNRENLAQTYHTRWANWPTFYDKKPDWAGMVEDVTNQLCDAWAKDNAPDLSGHLHKIFRKGEDFSLEQFDYLDHDGWNMTEIKPWSWCSPTPTKIGRSR